MFIQKVNQKDLKSLKVGDSWNDKGLFIKDKDDLFLSIAPKYKNGNFKQSELTVRLSDGKVITNDY
jgi:hypothetical protein